MQFVSYTIYPSHVDPAPNRGRRPDMVGMTIKPLPSISKSELLALIRELEEIADKMEH